MAATLRAIGEPGAAAAISALTSRRPAADLNAWSVACRSAISRKSSPIRGPGGAPACTAASAPSVSEAIWASESSTTAATRSSFAGKCRYNVPTATPAWRAMSSIVASTPVSATSARAASRIRSRLRCASTLTRTS